MKQRSLANPLFREDLKRLSQLNTPLSIALILSDFVIISAIAYVSYNYLHWAFSILAIMLIGNRQHSLLIQMHDASHGKIAKNKKLNDFMGEVLCAWPLFITMKGYREVHRKHHAHPNTSTDPDFLEDRFPRNRNAMLKLLFLDLIGLGAIEQLKNIKKYKTEMSVQMRVSRILFYVSMIAAISFLGLWKVYLIYWLLPCFTWLKLALRLRSIADHTGPGVYDVPHPFNTRTIIPNWFDIIFLAPRNCSYHLVHHTYDSIPGFRLKEAHEEMMAVEEFAKRARITHGFYNLYFELPKEDYYIDESTFYKSPSK